MVIDTDPQQAREALAIIETTTRRSLHEMRLLVSMLRDAQDHQAELSPVPGLGDLDRLVADTAAAGVTVEVTIDGTGHGLSQAADLSAYRIVQEALTNVVRHAGPTRARVQISYRPGELSIEVTDDGPSGRHRPRSPPARAAVTGSSGCVNGPPCSAVSYPPARTRAASASRPACPRPIPAPAICRPAAAPGDDPGGHRRRPGTGARRLRGHGQRGTRHGGAGRGRRTVQKPSPWSASTTPTSS